MPSELTTVAYKTFDGLTFLTFVEAKDHEDRNFSTLLVGLTADQIAAALDRKPKAIHIADALEKAGSIIGRARREAGQFRRPSRSRNGDEPDSAPPKGEPKADKPPTGGEALSDRVAAKEAELSA
jgi:hypothetical protein